MRRIRIGNDIAFSLRLTRNGEPEDLTGKELAVVLHRTATSIRMDYTVVDGVIKFIFAAAEQKMCGIYTITCTLTFGENNRNTVDICNAFELVPRSCMTDVETGNVTVAVGATVTSEHEELSAQVTVAQNGLSAYEIDRIHGYEGTEAEWLESLHGADGKDFTYEDFTPEQIAELQRPATEAAGKANEAAGKANAAASEATRVAGAVNELGNTLSEHDKLWEGKETARQDAERLRVSAESDRAKAEQVRVSAEGERGKAEGTRTSQETERVSAEKLRAEAETARVSQENTRVSAETERQEDERLRASAETNRATAETQRETNEATRKQQETTRETQENTRVSAENARVSAEQERVRAENARVEAEKQRQTNTATAISNANTATGNATAAAKAANEGAAKVNEAVSLAEQAKELLFRDMWNSACGSYGKYNEATGYYELNGLTDITYEQALDIMAIGHPILRTSFLIGYNNLRTTLQVLTKKTWEGDQCVSFSRGCEKLEVLNMQSFSISKSYSTFSNCVSLREIKGKIYFPVSFSDTYNTRIFERCYSLEEVGIYWIAGTLYLSDSPLINIKSFGNIVTEAKNTSPISIFVHPDVYSKFTDPANTEWYALNQQAIEKQISFAVYEEATTSLTDNTEAL